MPELVEGRDQEMTARVMGARVSKLVLLVAAIGACGDGRPSRPIEAWLLCDECVDGERAAVRSLGDAAVPELADALLNGPPKRIRRTVRQEATGAHSRAGAGVGTLSASQYADQMVDNYVAKYQERAAVALGDIRTTQAKGVLDRALQPTRRSQYRADVWRAIRSARMAIDATSFGGKFERSVVDFGDTAFLLAPPARLFTRNDMVTFDAMAFPPGDLLLSRTSGRLGFAAAGAPGSHLIAIRTLGTGRTEVAGFIITSGTDGNDRAIRKCPDRACEISRSPIVPVAALPTSPYNSFLSLRSVPPPPDSLDMFRFMPSSPLRVTAELDWSDTTNLDLSWRTCSQFTEVGNSDGATTTTKPERTTVDIPGGDCWVLLVVLKSRLPVTTFAHLNVKSP